MEGLDDAPLEHGLHHGDGQGDVTVVWTHSESVEVPLQLLIHNIRHVEELPRLPVP